MTIFSQIEAREREYKEAMAAISRPLIRSMHVRQELLEALDRLLLQCDRLRLPGQTESDAEKTARDVSAKARGEA